MKTIIGVIFLVFIIIIGMTAIEKDRAIFYTSLNQGNESQNIDDSTNNEEVYFYVTLSGEIQKPGTYEIIANSYLEEIIALASGVTTQADTDCFDYYLIIEENLEIYIPPISNEKKVSLNTATLEELTQLSGIGKVLGNRIITYREENGNFKFLEEIMKIDGIGKALFFKIRDQICL